MPEYTESDMLSALQAVTEGCSTRKAALRWGIPRTSLRHRLTGIQPRSVAFQGQQKLSHPQEAMLAHWVTTQAAMGNAINHGQLRDFAQRILKAQGDSVTLGKRWVSRFLKRFPTIKVRRKRAVDFRRVNGATPLIIQQWFRRFHIPAIQAIKPENRWNLDEAGIMEGRGSNGLVLGGSESQFIQKKQPGSRTWTTFLECISATGRALDPLVIFKGKTIQQQWFPLNLKPYEGWNFTSHPKGWVCDETALEWLRKVFVRGSLPEGTQKNTRPSEARLLVCDGHGSHITDEFMWECYQANIYVIYLPPHTSYVLQPLDISIFGPLKSAYRKRLDNLATVDDRSAVGKRNFLSCYEAARKEALTESNIRAGWRGTGLWPLSANRALSNPLVVKRSEGNTRSYSLPPDPLLQEVSQVDWETPRTVKVLRDELHIFDQMDQDPYTKRLLFRKINKAFDEKNTDLAMKQREIEVLRARLDNIQARKRKKVELSPNSKFASIRDVYRAQRAAGDREDSPRESSESELSSEAESCIVVNGRLV